ncbi:hypothetical protein K435DRAFT_793570 [Dendrothele bispora CBS 962.96]|uniref:CFEM domain-containing protein n=1 Tax=Dendrothele bispora (strain CBS 962.96) TaxID=1314807 RepID=A0A4V6T5K2_DENBC|nr:hypothetical protein K435DRAFT_793570 [Dendrothele bispora CBS 962.96]
MFNSKLAVLLAFALVAVNAQSDCLTTCITQNLGSSSCSSIFPITNSTDIACLCNDTALQGAVASCLTSNCPDQLASAAQTQAQQCASASSGSGSSSSTASGGASSGASGSGTSSAPSGTSTSPSGSTTRSTSPSNTAASASGSSPSPTGNAAAPGTLVSGPGAALAMVVGLAGVAAGAVAL